MPLKNGGSEKVRISLASGDKVSVNVTGASPSGSTSGAGGSSPGIVVGVVGGGGDNLPSTNPGGVYLSHKNPVSRSTSNRSSNAASQLKPQFSSQTEKQRKEKKLGHRRVGYDGEVTYKKFETTQLIGSIQLGIQHSVGSLANLDPNRDLLMQDFMSIDQVYFTKDGLLQKTPAHNYSEFRFRTYASLAFRRFRELFNIETDMYLASLCSEPMIELSNAGASGSIFYVTSDDNFICKTVQHKEAEFLQKISMGYYLNLDQNQRTLLPKFFGLYCYSCNAKNVRLVTMNNLFPSELKMHCKYDLKGSTYKRKANRQERAKSSPTFKDLDFMEMFPEGITLQNDIYSSLMNSIERDCRVLESFKIMDYSLLVGIHNLDQAVKDRETEPATSSYEVGAGSDWESGSGTTDGDLKQRSYLERQGSVVHRERMIAHSTALESITMEVDHSGSNQPSTHERVAQSNHSKTTPRHVSTSYDELDTGGINNVWGGIPAKNHRGENLLLFIGIIDILQCYGMFKKVEHYWKSLIHDGDAVSVHRPSFYARRFQNFMKDKVFKKQSPAATVKPALSFRRSHFRRTLSSSERETEVKAADLGPPTRGGGAKDNSVTVITIDNAGASANVSDEVFLPPVLQDRKPRTVSGGSSTQKHSSSSASNGGDSGATVSEVPNPEAETTSEVHVVKEISDPQLATPSSTLPKIYKGLHVDERNAETGSIITMTSDERVQIFVPSPSGGGTPYSTITKMSNHEFQRTLISDLSSPRPPSTSISWNEASNTTSVQIPPKSNSTTFNIPQSGGSSPQPGPPFSRRVITSSYESYRSLTPLNMELASSNSSSPKHKDLEMIKVSFNSDEDRKKTETTTCSVSDATIADSDFPSLPTDGHSLEPLNEQPLSLSDIQLIDEDD